MGLNKKIFLKKYLMILYLFILMIGSIVIIEYIEQMKLYEENIYIVLMQFLLGVSILICLIVIKFNEKNLINPILILIITIIIFNAGRVITDLFGIGDFAEITWFANYRVSSYVQFKTIVSLNFAIQGLTSGTILYNIFTKEELEYSDMKESIDLYLVGTLIFKVMIIFFIYKNLYIGYNVLTNGYMSMYSSTLSVPGGSIVNLATYFYKFSFYIILASMAEKKKANKYIKIYFITLLISLITGVRGLVMTEILALLTYLAMRSEYNINYIKVGLLGIFIFMVSIFVGGLRSGVEVYDIDSIKRERPIVDFINEQGFSLNVLSLAIENEITLGKDGSKYIMHPVIFGDLAKPFVKKIDSTNMYGVTTYSLAHKISYMTNRYVYLSGGGMGGSYLAELYLLFGKYSILLGNILIGFLLKKIFYLMKKNRKWLYIGMYMLPYIYYMPRSYTLGFCEIILRPLIFGYIVWVIRRKIRNASTSKAL